MIYLIIADNDSIKKDCLDRWQSYSLFSDEIKEYIANTKNEKTKKERILAYSALFASLKEIFSLDAPRIYRNENGKPFIKDGSIYISISHSEDACAVALSDEGEIGVDIQSPIDESKAERLNERFLSKIQPKQENIDVKCLYMTISDDKIEFTNNPLNNSTEEDFLSKWVYFESIIKAFGLTFSDLPKINRLQKNTKTVILNYKNSKIAVTKTF